MIHKTAIIHPSAVLGANVEIGPYAVIGEDTVLKDGVKIAAHAVVEYSEVGENTVIFSHAAVGSAPQDLKFKGEKTKLVIGSNCMIREFVTLNRGTTASGVTKIGSNCLLMAYVHVAHDCVVGNGVIMANAATLGGHVEVGENAVLSSLIAVHQFTRIGQLAMVGGGSMVSLDIMPFAQCQGDRSKLVGLNLVGLRRKGYSKDAIEEVKSAYKILFLSGITMEEALDQLEATDPKKEVREMINFIRASKRGICRPGRKEINEEL